MIVVLTVLISCVTGIIITFILTCGDAINTRIDNTIAMIECTNEDRKLREKVQELQKEIERLKSERGMDSGRNM